jgi:hypothetical protein
MREGSDKRTNQRENGEIANKREKSLSREREREKERGRSTQRDSDDANGIFRRNVNFLTAKNSTKRITLFNQCAGDFFSLAVRNVTSIRR